MPKLVSAEDHEAEARRLEVQAAQLRERAQTIRERDRGRAMAAAAQVPVDRSAVQLAGGGEVTADHRELKDNGQQKGYVVLSDSERAKGFVRPYRDAYRHVGARPTRPTRELTEDEHRRYDQYGYVVFEPYPDRDNLTGRFWTQAQLDSGCGEITTMSRDIAETYARDPKFYSGTFCTHCRKHFPVGEGGEFTWYEMDGQEGPRVGT